MERPKVAISNGFHKMHLTIAAREAEDRELLSLVITGVYPTPFVGKLFKLLRVTTKGRLGRILQRDEGLPRTRLHAVFLPELLDLAAAVLGRVSILRRVSLWTRVATWRLYGLIAARKLRHARDARIFQYRAGFGGASVGQARRLGMVTLCDHALAHPLVLGSLVENRGRFPDRDDDGEAARPVELEAHSRAILKDIARADAVVVNSHFVKDTFQRTGWPAERIHVAYTGVDDNFFEVGGPEVPRREAPTGRLPLIYASVLEKRKGAETLLEALRGLDQKVDWDLVIAGPVSPDVEASHGSFLRDERIRITGPLSRTEFKAEMIARPVFLFPSYAEGSARAVFDALACGCYVITTPNAGSIVEDGVHGSLVPPGDAEALVDAVAEADRDRRRIADIGNRNAQLIAARYRQSDYGDALAAIYRDLLAGSAAP